jgi:hypothetical protein
MARPSKVEKARSPKLAVLKRARIQKRIVRFWNPYDPGSTTGYVLDIGPQFILLALIDENIRFNGFQCLRIADVRRIKLPYPFEWFVTVALRKRKETLSTKPDIDLRSISTLIQSASQISPLITIHRERKCPDSCWIGKVKSVTGEHVTLLEIGPDAGWDEKPSKYLLREITRVDFGGGYEEALHLVGGSPPKIELSSKRK